MTRRITIVMYHFVRDLKHSRYPEIKGLETTEFIEQIEYIRRFYTVISMEQLIAATFPGRESLPPNALLLTFDDGYADHFTKVFPVLNRYGLQGSFFPPTKAILEHKVLDVNKIHFVLASVEEKSRIIRFINAEIEKNISKYGLDQPDTYYKQLAVPNRYDTAEVVFIKRVLQKGLPEELRTNIVNKLFAEFVTLDEAAFAKELYMSVEQLETMRRHGMHIGSHGYGHYWLNTIGKEEQKREIDLSLEFLNRIGCDLENWVMCYPFGGYNDSLLNLLRDKGCRIGLSVNVGIADLEVENPLTLSRLDTNDLPKRRDASPNEWTLLVTEGRRRAESSHAQKPQERNQ
jgi:peptidoglycan/xylan/chitin deacetylase (PgdA/CDA1 family)